MTDEQAFVSTQDLRQRFMQDGLKGFEDREVIELILSYSGRSAGPERGAALLTERRKGLRNLFDAPADELAEATGRSGALLIRLIKSLAGKYLLQRLAGADVVAHPEVLRDFLILTLSGERIEKFLAVFLDASCKTLAAEVLHKGTINQTAVYPRASVEAAMRLGAVGMIFVHNHPSGDPTPSSQDRNLIQSLDNAAAAVGLIVHDHLIAGRKDIWSAKQNGWRMGRPSAPPKPQKTAHSG